MNLMPALIRQTPSLALKRLLWSLVRRRAFFYRATTPQGWAIHGNTVDWIQRNLYYFGVWEPNLSAWIERRLSPGDTFVDVGANIGYFTLLAADRVGPLGRVVSIEPMPEIFDHLSAHVTANTRGNVRLISEAAVGPGEEGPVTLYWGGDDNAGSTGLIRRQPNSRSTTVAGRTLALILTDEEREHARIIKIDVEGVEMRVLRGLGLESGRFSKSMELVVEVSDGDNAGDASMLVDYMRHLGYVAYVLPENYSFRHLINARAAPLVPQRLAGPLPGMRNVVFSRIDADAL